MAQTKAQLIDGKSATVEFSSGSASTPSIAFSGDPNTGIYSPGADTVAISTNGSQRVTVDSTGKLGIGTASPSARFNVSEANTNPVSTTSTDVNRILLTDASGSTSAGVGYSLDVEGIYGGLGRISIAKSNSLTTGTTRDNGAFRLFLNQNLGADSYGALNEALTIDSGGTDQGFIYRFRGTEQFRIDSSGRLLVGTSSQSKDSTLVLQGSALSGSNNESGLWMQRGTSSPANGDALGRIVFSDNTGEGSADIRVFRDGGTWSGSSKPGRLVFSTTPDGSATPVERLRISNNGRHRITGTQDFIEFVNTQYSSSTYSYIGRDQNGAFVVYTDGNTGVYLSAGATSWTGSSDERLKCDLKPIGDALNKVSHLRAVTGRYKTDEPEVSRSFLIAQDVQAVLPEAVDAANEDHLGLRYTEVIPLLVAALKESKERIEVLEQRLADAGIA